MGQTESSRAANAVVKSAGMCWTIRIGGVSAGSRVSSVSMACVPPVDAPIRIRPLACASFTGAGVGAGAAAHVREAHRASGPQRANAVLQFGGDITDRVRSARFGDDVDRAGGQRLDARGRSGLRHRAHDDHRQRMVRHQLAQEGQAVHARHLDVERDHVRLVLQDQVARDERIRREADHLHVRLGLERVGEHPPHDRGIVDDEDARLRRGHGHDIRPGRTPRRAATPSAATGPRRPADRRWRRAIAVRRRCPARAPT